MILVVPSIEVNATGENHLYYQTIKCKEADNYVKETLGDFINYESNLVMLKILNLDREFILQIMKMKICFHHLCIQCLLITY